MISLLLKPVWVSGEEYISLDSQYKVKPCVCLNMWP